jgi:ABC-2 type transport system permease protein
MGTVCGNRDPRPAMGATVLLAERLYRRALLQTQGRVTLKQAWRATD